MTHHNSVAPGVSPVSAKRFYCAIFAAMLMFMSIAAPAVRADTATSDAVGDIVTNIGGKFSGSEVNVLIGADRFYNAGYTGANTKIANIEAGLVWNGHDSLTQVTQFSYDTSVNAGSQTGEFDRHATWVGSMLAGRPGSTGYAAGIAYGADLRSGAIATQWSTSSGYSTSFDVNTSTFYTPYTSTITGFGHVDVINSSWGADGNSSSGIPSGTDYYSLQIDGLANANPLTTMVVAAGNSGSGTNKVSSPASGYNSISVGALANNGADVYDTVASFSSGGPQEYYDITNGTVAGVRAAVDIVAPGNHLTLAHYGGTTGGNIGGTADGTSSSYDANMAGTSFAAPTVAGSVALLDDAAYARNLASTARDSRVIKAVLLNSADKIAGWNNGQHDVSGVVTTTQSLDYYSGAGALNLDTAFDQYLSGQTDIAGTAGGVSAASEGWDFATVARTSFTDIVLTQTFLAGSTFTTTLDWFRDRASFNKSNASDDAFANLDLQVWDSTFTTLLAESISEYNNVEHLSFTLGADTQIGLRVTYDSNMFGTQNSADFAVAWRDTAVATSVPTPMALTAGLLLLPLTVTRRRRRS